MSEEVEVTQKPQEAAEEKQVVAAAQETTGDDEGGWLGGWGNTLGSVWEGVKTTAEEVVEAYKEDLQDFAVNISQDTERVMEDVRQSELLVQAKETAVAGSTALVNQLVDGIVAHTEADSPQKAPNRLQSKLIELQKDMGTFCTVPSDAEFEAFAQNFNAADREPTIITLLAESSVLADNYNKFVPVVVSYEDFWRRYFFRESKLVQAEEERKELIAKASEMAAAASQEDLTWEDDDGDANETEWKGEVADGLNFSTIGTPTQTEDLLLEGWDDEDLNTPEIVAKIDEMAAQTPVAAGDAPVEIIEDYSQGDADAAEWAAWE